MTALTREALARLGVDTGARVRVRTRSGLTVTGILSDLVAEVRQAVDYGAPRVLIVALVVQHPDDTHPTVVPWGAVDSVIALNPAPTHPAST